MVRLQQEGKLKLMIFLIRMLLF